MANPPLVKKGRGIFIKSVKYIAHERFTNEAAAIGYVIAVEIALEHTHLTVVEHDSYSMLTRLAFSSGAVMRWFSHVFSVDWNYSIPQDGGWKNCVLEIYAESDSHIRIGSGGYGFLISFSLFDN